MGNNGWCDVVNGLVDAPVDDAPGDGTPVEDDSDCGTEEAYSTAGTCGTGGCYDVDGSFSGIAHRCACQENSCNESLCDTVGGIWTSGCTSAWCNNGWCDVVNGLDGNNGNSTDNGNVTDNGN